MRILVTNDDGVHAPGLAALTAAMARAPEFAHGDGSSVTVVAPLSNHSGASAAVGAVLERPQIPYKVVVVEGAEGVQAFGVDATPALAVILAALGAFGPVPNVVVSGINLGVNVGRSVLHSGTVGAVLTAAQLGINGLAVSLRSHPEPPQWETAATLARLVVPQLARAPVPTSLSLNVPSVPLSELRGVRRGGIGAARIIRSAEDPEQPTLRTGQPRFERTGGDVGGYLHLELGSAIPALGDVSGEGPHEDASLVAAGFASLTPILGVREDPDATTASLVARLVTLLDRPQ